MKACLWLRKQNKRLPPPARFKLETARSLSHALLTELPVYILLVYVYDGVKEEGSLNVNRSAPHYRSLEIDGWMTCHLMSFSTVFQSYQDNGWVIIKYFVQRKIIYG